RRNDDIVIRVPGHVDKSRDRQVTERRAVLRAIVVTDRDDTVTEACRSQDLEGLVATRAGAEQEHPPLLEARQLGTAALHRDRVRPFADEHPYRSTLEMFWRRRVTGQPRLHVRPVLRVEVRLVVAWIPPLHDVTGATFLERGR